MHGIARQLGTSWKTVWRAVEPELVKLAEDESRFEGVTTLGVDEHIWHHVDPRKRGPKELTGMVDLSRDSTGKTRARLLDLVPGRSGKAYASWLAERGEAFRQNVKVAALDPFAGYKTAIDDKLEDATAVLDAFHVVKLGTAGVDTVTISKSSRRSTCSTWTPSRPSRRSQREHGQAAERASAHPELS